MGILLERIGLLFFYDATIVKDNHTIRRSCRISNRSRLVLTDGAV